MTAQPISRQIAWVLFATAMPAYMLLSPSVLGHMGIPYDSPQGFPLAKFHIGSYCLIFAWFMALSSHGNPLRVMSAQMARHRLLGIYWVSMVGVFFWVVFRHGTSGAAFIIEALWMPVVAAFALDLFDARRRRQTLQLVMLLLAGNALLAVGEALSGANLVPASLESSGLVAEVQFRATAFLGHPLHNALITASLLPAVTLLPLSRVGQIMLILLLLLSLLAFGGRTSIGLAVLLYGPYFFISACRKALRGGFNYLQLTGGSLALMLGTTGVLGFVAATGLGDRIFKNMKMDNSAGVRLKVWDAFDYLSESDFWFGIAPIDIDHIALLMGLDPKYEAIENFWIYNFMQFGVVGFTPFVVALACLVLVLWRAATPPMRVATLLYFLVASTANTLAAKTMSLMLLVVVILAGATQQRLPTTVAARGLS